MSVAWPRDENRLKLFSSENSRNEESVRGRVMPPFNLEWVRYTYRTRGSIIARKFVDSVEVFNVERASILRNPEILCEYVYAPHTSILDYLIAKKVILDNGLKYERTIAGDNLLNPIVRIGLGIDLAQWGLIVKKRKSPNEEEKRAFVEAREYAFKEERLGVGGWVEGGDKNGARNRNPEGGLRRFPASYFIPLVRARINLNKPIYVSCVHFAYDDIPERGYFEKMDNSRLGRIGYFLWDMYACLKWQRRNFRANAYVNFAEPRELLELVGEGKSVNRSAINLAKAVKKIHEDLGKELQSQRSRRIFIF